MILSILNIRRTIRRYPQQAADRGHVTERSEGNSLPVDIDRRRMRAIKGYAEIGRMSQREMWIMVSTEGDGSVMDQVPLTRLSVSPLSIPLGFEIVVI